VTLERERADLATDRAHLAAARERLRMGRELHDVLGHAFSVMVVQAGAAERLLDTDPARARTALQQVSATGRSSLADLRTMVTVLRSEDDADRSPADPPELGPSPRLADVPALVDRVRGAGLDVDLDLDLGSAPEAASRSGVELAAYRIVQESLTNCLKHAHATTAWVRIRCRAEQLELEVRDDGTGQPEPQPESEPQTERTPENAAAGHGLAGMRERVAIYGGALDAGPSPAGGYRVRASLPVPP